MTNSPMPNAAIKSDRKAITISPTLATGIAIKPYVISSFSSKAGNRNDFLAALPQAR
jgi:hypothetical protein